MTIIPIIIGAVIIILLAAVLVFVIKKKPASAESTHNPESLQLLLQQMNELARSMHQQGADLTRTVDQKLGQVDQKLVEGQRELHESLKYQTSRSQELIREITREITEVKETGKHVLSFADQLKSLQDILKNPKQRGVLGEYYLETLLKNILPGSYQMQYAFSDGTIVDAVVFVKDKIIPIDSKFSLENYNRISETSDPVEKERLEKLFANDLKNRIVETSKYIKPSENTMDFAFMFIPHEAIYYDLLVNKIGALQNEDTENLLQRAAGKYKVIIVSPTSFLAYLQTVLQGLKAMQIEESAKDIIKRVSELGKHIAGYEEYYDKLGKSLATTVNHYNSAGKELKKIDKDVTRITGETIDITLETVERPMIED